MAVMLMLCHCQNLRIPNRKTSQVAVHHMRAKARNRNPPRLLVGAALHRVVRPHLGQVKLPELVLALHLGAGDPNGMPSSEPGPKTEPRSGCSVFSTPRPCHQRLKRFGLASQNHLMNAGHLQVQSAVGAAPRISWSVFCSFGNLQPNIPLLSKPAEVKQKGPKCCGTDVYMLQEW